VDIDDLCMLFTSLYSNKYTSQFIVYRQVHFLKKDLGTKKHKFSFRIFLVIKELTPWIIITEANYCLAGQ
jgi:hypothetical protein